MSRKSSLAIKKTIIKVLKERECSLRELETKVNTNYITIRNHCLELEFLDIIKLIKYEKNDMNGRPYTTAKLTKNGQAILGKLNINEK